MKRFFLILLVLVGCSDSEAPGTLLTQSSPTIDVAAVPLPNPEVDGWINSNQKRATAINNEGLIAGFGWNNAVEYRCLFFGNSAGLAYTQNCAIHLDAFSLNDAGQFALTFRGATGYSWGLVSLNSDRSRPFQDLGVGAYGINNHGTAVGYDYDDGVLILKDGEVQQLKAENGTLYFRDINDAEQFIGSAYAGGEWRSVLYEKGLLTEITAPGMSNRVIAINNVGQVLGTTTFADGSTQPFTWTKEDGARLVGREGSYAVAINDRGWVLGGPEPYLWTEAHGVIGLPVLPDYDNATAAGLNDRGEIVGTSTRPGDISVTLWTLDFGPQSAAEGLSRLGELLNASKLDAGNLIGLERKLSAAQRALERRDLRAVRGQLEAFGHQLDALMRNGRLENGSEMLELIAETLALL